MSCVIYCSNNLQFMNKSSLNFVTFWMCSQNIFNLKNADFQTTQNTAKYFIWFSIIVVKFKKKCTNNEKLKLIQSKKTFIRMIISNLANSLPGSNIMDIMQVFLADSKSYLCFGVTCWRGQTRTTWKTLYNIDVL